MSEIKTVFVAGAGVMGNGIAQVAADHGYAVKIYDLQEEFLDRAMKTIEDSLQRFVKKGKKSEEEKERIISSI